MPALCALPVLSLGRPGHPQSSGDAGGDRDRWDHRHLARHPTLVLCDRAVCMDKCFPHQFGVTGGWQGRVPPHGRPAAAGDTAGRELPVQSAGSPVHCGDESPSPCAGRHRARAAGSDASGTSLPISCWRGPAPAQGSKHRLKLQLQSWAGFIIFLFLGFLFCVFYCLH